MKTRWTCLRLYKIHSELNWAQAENGCCEACSNVPTWHSQHWKMQRGLTANKLKVLSENPWTLSNSAYRYFAYPNLLGAPEAPSILPVWQGKCKTVSILAFSRGDGKMPALQQSNDIADCNGPTHLKGFCNFLSDLLRPFYVQDHEIMQHADVGIDSPPLDSNGSLFAMRRRWIYQPCRFSLFTSPVTKTALFIFFAFV